MDRLTALNALSLAVSTNNLSLDEVINMALAGAVGTTGAEGGGASVNLAGRPPIQHSIGQTGTLDPSWVLQYVPADRDYVELTDSHIPEPVYQDGIQHLVIAPLRGTNLTMGAIWLGYPQPTTSQAQREMTVLYAKMAGGVLENMYLDGQVVSAYDRMASILSSASEGMALIEENGIVGVANRAFGQLLGVDELQWQGRHMDEFCGDHEVLGLPRELRVEICDYVAQVLGGRRQEASGEIKIGADRDLTWHVLPVRGAAAESTGALLVIHDVTAERHMERLRQDLSNMIVHDLRSPLTNIMVSVDLLLKQSTGPLNESQSRILNIAAVSCQQMLDLVNALLDIRRLQQQTLDLQRLPIEVARLADVVVERLERIAEDKRIGLDNDLEALPAVFADPDMIRRVLQNLVDNALKFSKAGSYVRLTGRVAQPNELPIDHPDGNWVVVTVQDQGVGIPEEYHQVIFELFTQAPGGYGRGTGVGLAFCRLAVEAHGGRIWVESVPNQGSTFFFTLPVA